jgi:maltose O-acetyltransferase
VEKFLKTGKNFKFDPFGKYSFNTIEVGDDVYIGMGATFLASNSKIILGNKIMCGPNVTMMGGDHNVSVIGKFMFDVKEKLPENDLPIIIKDDVWIGTGVIILKGVTIGRGSIVAAGSLVNKDIPPYSIAVGIPARIVKKRFTEEEITIHENLIYSKENSLL